MTSEQKLCPKCISLFPGNETACPRCGGPLQLLPSTTSSSPQVAPQEPLPPEGSTPPSVPVAQSTASTAASAQHTSYTCPFCESVILNSTAIICPTCNRTLPANWRDWTNSGKARLTPTQHSVAVKPTTPVPNPTGVIPGKIHMQDNRSGIVHPSLSTFELYIRITRALGYLAVILTVISLCVSIMSLGSAMGSRSSMNWIGGMIGFGALPFVFVGLFIAFTLFLTVDVLEMQKANTENTIFLAQRANESEMTEKRILQTLENIQSLLANQQHRE